MAGKAKPRVSYPVVVIGVDPGGTTGAAVVKLTDDSYEFLEAHQFSDERNAWAEVQALVHNYRRAYPVHLVVEQFDKRPGIIDPDFSAKYVERDIDNNVTGFTEYYKQIPGEIKFFIREARKNNGKGDALNRWGLYQTGMKHANDAVRHVLTYAVMRLKHKPTILRGWPKPES